MGAIFAVQVKTGSEISAKEQLKHAFMRTGETLLKGIYSLETHTEIVKSGVEGKEIQFEVNEDDIAYHLTKEKYNMAIGNLRQQYEVIDSYDSKSYMKMKRSYKDEINRLEKELSEVRETTKRVHCVLNGYILIELHTNSTYLPDHIWHLINSVDLVQRVLSTTPIPEYEIEQFFSNITEITEPKVIMSFDKDLEYQEVEQKTEELITKVNHSDTPKEKSSELLEEIDNLLFNVVKRTKEFLSNRPENRFLKRVKAFVRRGRRFVSIPLSLYEKLYDATERACIGQLINGKDFLNRLKSVVNEDSVVSTA